MRPILDDYENEIEENISQFKPAGSAKKELIEGIIEQKGIDLFSTHSPDLPTSRK